MLNCLFLSLNITSRVYHTIIVKTTNIIKYIYNNTEKEYENQKKKTK